MTATPILDGMTPKLTPEQAQWVTSLSPEEARWTEEILRVHGGEHLLTNFTALRY